MKKNDAIVALAVMIVLIVLLTQPHVTDTIVGRIAIVIAVITVAAVNKIAGLIAVLVVIISIQRQTYTVHSYNFYEGFRPGFKKPNSSRRPPSKDSSKPAAMKLGDAFAKEGFCLSDKESTILRGKQSNSIPVSNTFRSETENVSPSSKSVFSGDFASLD